MFTIMPRWKNNQEILNQFGLIVYPRPNAEKSELINHENVEMIDAPILDISATLIRRLIKEGKSVKYLVPDEVERMITAKGFYL